MSKKKLLAYAFDNTYISCMIGQKQYELTNHLGNVITTLSDRKIGVDAYAYNTTGTPKYWKESTTGSGIYIYSTSGATHYQTTASDGQIDYYIADVQTITDYYPGGYQMGGRSVNLNTYGFGHNGQRRSSELYDDHYTAEFWEFDARTIRRWNLDPKPQISISDYACFGDNPIVNADVNGDIFGGKTKDDAEKAKTHMENTLGEGGKAFVDRYYTIDENNVFRLRDGFDKRTVRNEMRNWMNSRGQYGKDGEKKEEASKYKYTKKQQALAMGYTGVITDKSYTVIVNFDNNKYPGESKYNHEDEKNPIGIMVIGTREYFFGWMEKSTVGLSDGTQLVITEERAFVHELLGEAVGWHLNGLNWKVLFDDINNDYPLDKNSREDLTVQLGRYSVKGRAYTLHCIQAENLLNENIRLGLDHDIPVYIDDYDKVGLIPDAFK